MSRNNSHVSLLITSEAKQQVRRQATTSTYALFAMFALVGTVVVTLAVLQPSSRALLPVLEGAALRAQAASLSWVGV